MTTRNMLSTLLAAAALPVIAQAETIELSRTQAVQMALERNETHRSVLLEADRVRGQFLEARAGALPQLTLEGEYMRNLELPTSVITFGDSTIETTFGTKNDYRMTLRLHQPLYVAGKVGAALKIAGYATKLTDAQIEISAHTTAVDADKAYLDAVAAAQSVLVYSEAERLSDSNLAVVEKLYAQGQISEFDLLRAQVSAANARPPRIQAENNSRLALDRLRNLLALAPETRLVIDTGIAESIVPDLTADALLAEAEANRPELKAVNEQVNINQKLIDIARGGYKPTLALNSSLQWQGLSDDFKPAGSEWYRSWNASLNLTWPLFNGFETSGRVRQAKVDLHQSELMESQLSRQVRLEVRKAHGDVLEARQRVAALGRTVEQADRGVQIARVRFHNGVGTQLELLDAQVALTAARVNRISALHDLAVAVSELRLAVGRPWAQSW